MVNWLLRWIASGIAIAIVANLGIGIHYASLSALALATVVFGLLNSLVRPVLGILALPLNCLTMGMFGFALNALLFFIAGNAVHGFHVGFEGALVGPFLIGLVSGLLNFLLPDKKEKD